MMTTKIKLPVTLMRGGTSKGAYLLRKDMPPERKDWDSVLLKDVYKRQMSVTMCGPAVNLIGRPMPEAPASTWLTASFPCCRPFCQMASAASMKGKNVLP